LCLCSGVLSSIDTLYLPPEDKIPDEHMPLESSWGKTPSEIVKDDDCCFQPAVSFAAASSNADDTPFIVLTETKFSFRCIPVWDRYSPYRTRV
jgi:hypothetical protein